MIVYALVFFSLMQFLCGSVEYSSTTLLHGYVEFCSSNMSMIFFFFLFLATVSFGDITVRECLFIF